MFRVFDYKSNFLTRVWSILFLASKDFGSEGEGEETVDVGLNNGEESSEGIAHLSIR